MPSRKYTCPRCHLAFVSRKSPKSIRCPACGEEDPGKLPFFTAPLHEGVRIEACDSCKIYVKSIDLSLDARRVPEIDDLVSLSMDLWATEHAYVRMEPGLAGL